MSQTKIFVSGFPYQVTEDELEKYFNKFGEIKKLNIVYDRETGKSRGFAFIDFENQASADSAIQSNGQQLFNRNLRISAAKEKNNNGN